MAVVTQAVITVGAVYVSLGTTQAGTGMLISPEGEIEIVLAAAQPAAAAPGHPIGMSSLPYLMPFFSQQVWAISVTGAQVFVNVSL
jgi:hypothetical protein